MFEHYWTLKKIPIFFLPKVLKFTWKIRNRLNRKKIGFFPFKGSRLRRHTSKIFFSVRGSWYFVPCLVSFHDPSLHVLKSLYIQLIIHVSSPFLLHLFHNIFSSIKLVLNFSRVVNIVETCDYNSLSLELCTL